MYQILVVVVLRLVVYNFGNTRYGKLFFPINNEFDNISTSRGGGEIPRFENLYFFCLYQIFDCPRLAYFRNENPGADVRHLTLNRVQLRMGGFSMNFFPFRIFDVPENFVGGLSASKYE